MAVTERVLNAAAADLYADLALPGTMLSRYVALRTSRTSSAKYPGPNR
jgi:hypothetical protein